MRISLFTLLAFLCFSSMGFAAAEPSSGPGAGSGASDPSNQGTSSMSGKGGLGMGGGAVGATGTTKGAMAENPGNTAGSYNATPGSTKDKAANSMFSDAFNKATGGLVTNLNDPIAKAAINANYAAAKAAIHNAGLQANDTKPDAKTETKTDDKATPTKTTDTKATPTKTNTANFGGRSGEDHDGSCLKSYHTILGKDKCEKNEDGVWKLKEGLVAHQ